MFLSCSQGQTEKVSPTGISLDIDEHYERPTPRVSVTAVDSQNYGPQSKNTYLNRPVPKVSPQVMGLILGPGIYRTMAMIPILKEIEKNNVAIHFIGGHGLSAIIAAYFAFGVKPDHIEWKVHKFFAHHKEQEPYSREWINSWKEQIKKDFGQKKIEQAKLNLFIPLYNKSKQTVEYITRGSLYHALSHALRLTGQRENYRAAFVQQIYNPTPLKKLGVDKINGISVLDNNLSWKQGNDFLVGTFTKAAGKSLKEAEEMDLFFQVELKGMDIDSVEQLPEIMRLGRISAANIVEELRSKEHLDKKE